MLPIIHYRTAALSMTHCKNVLTHIFDFIFASSPISATIKHLLRGGAIFDPHPPPPLVAIIAPNHVWTNNFP